MSEIIKIEFDPREMQVIWSALIEYGGGSSYVMGRISSHSTETISPIYEMVKECRTLNVNSLALAEDQWRVIYDSINATIYALGPFELEICTGCGLIDILQTNLTIATHVWGAYGGARWSDYYKAERA